MAAKRKVTNTLTPKEGVPEIGGMSSEYIMASVAKTIAKMMRKTNFTGTKDKFLLIRQTSKALNKISQIKPYQ